MSKKRNPLEDPPAASSSDDEELVSSAEEEDDANSSSSSEDDPIPPPSSSTVTIAVPAKLPSDSDSETESGSESDQPPNQKSTVLAAPPPPPAVALALPAAKKRPLESKSKETNAKRSKDNEEKDAKKPGAFQRLWTEEDEISVLQGMIDFKNDTGNSPYDDTNVYYDYIKKSISFEVSKNQFMDKIRSLRKKYIGKEKPSFAKPHDQRAYTLCQFIWGPDGMGLDSAVKSNGAAKKSKNNVDSIKQMLSFDDDDDDADDDWFESSFLVKAIAGFGVDENCVRQRWSLVPGESKEKVEEKVKMLQDKEIEFVLQKTKVLHEMTCMIAEASKKQGV